MTENKPIKHRTPRKIPEHLTELELKTYLNTPYKTQIHHLMAMRLMAQCGLRVAEAVKVRPVDFTPFTRFTKLKVHGKGSKDRLVPVPLELWNVINHHIKDNVIKYDEYLFPGVKGATMTTANVREFVKGYGVKAGIQKNMHPHLLRHTFAVLYLQAGGNLRALQKILGHSSMTTTQIYLELTEDEIFEDFLKHPVVV